MKNWSLCQGVFSKAFTDLCLRRMKTKATVQLRGPRGQPVKKTNGKAECFVKKIKFRLNFYPHSISNRCRASFFKI